MTIPRTTCPHRQPRAAATAMAAIAASPTTTASKPAALTALRRTARIRRGNQTGGSSSGNDNSSRNGNAGTMRNDGATQYYTAQHSEAPPSVARRRCCPRLQSDDARKKTWLCSQKRVTVPAYFPCSCVVNNKNQALAIAPPYEKPEGSLQPLGNQPRTMRGDRLPEATPK